MSEIVVSAKDIVFNGGTYYATNKITNKLGKKILDADHLLLKASNNLMIKYKRTNVNKKDDSVVVTFTDGKRNRLVFVI